MTSLIVLLVLGGQTEERWQTRDELSGVTRYSVYRVTYRRPNPLAWWQVLDVVKAVPGAVILRVPQDWPAGRVLRGKPRYAGQRVVVLTGIDWRHVRTVYRQRR